MYIIVNKQDNRIIDTVADAEIVDNTWVRSTYNSLLQLNMVEIVEVDSVPERAQFYSESKFYSLSLEEVAEIHKTILDELCALDIIIPRVVEDIITQGGFTIHQSKAATLLRKQELRAQLQALEV